MNTALWIVQGLLAFAFVAAGGMKLAKSREDLLSDPKMGWAEDFPAGAIKLIGVAELAGGLGLVLPQATGIVPVLTPVAAAAMVLVMLGAVGTHVKRGEMGALGPPAVLMLLSALVAWGRFAGVAG